jgi:hypothetical protein
MALNIHLDSYTVDRLDLPYNRILSELSSSPRIVDGLNMWTTVGGKLAKRPGTLEIANTASDMRIDRLWEVETLDTTPIVYLVASMYDSSNAKWVIKYFIPGTSTMWQTPTSPIRGIDGSSVPHELVVSRGLGFIRSVPTDTSDKLGTAIFDGTGGSVTIKPWGGLGPTTAARLGGTNSTISFLAADLTAAATTVDVRAGDGANFPATPFVAQIGFETVNVTNVATDTLTMTRAYLGTTAEAHPVGEFVLYKDWSASDHLVTVRIGWQYTYAYKSITGHVTSRSPLETNPDNLPSITGPFIDLKPQIVVQGLADTTNWPTIVIFRSTDGGGQWFELEEITNTGAGSITYTDDSLVSAAGTEDPLPDQELDQGTPAPTLTSNDPPPGVIAPDVVGTDNPVKGTPIVSYASRLWYAIGNILVYSGNEEINLGIPEESFPSGTFGNFFRTQYPIQNLAATSDALYVFTLKKTYRITGTNKETFNMRPIFEEHGAPVGHPRAIVSFKESIAFLTHDFRIALITPGNDPITLSDPLFTDIIDEANLGAEYDIKYWGDLEKEWLVVMAHNTDNPTFSHQWIYDLKKAQMVKGDYWFPKWNIRAVASLSDRIAQDTAQRRLTFFVWGPTAGVGRLVRIDPTVRTPRDVIHDGTTIGITFYADTMLHMIPVGNHVNALRRPGYTPSVHSISLERSLFDGDEDPDFYYYLDDFWSDPQSVDIAVDPTRRDQSKSYKTLVYPISKVGLRVAFRVSKISSVELFELQSYTITWNTKAGA